MKAVMVEYGGPTWRILLDAGWEPSERVRDHQLMVAPMARMDDLDRAMTTPIWGDKRDETLDELAMLAGIAKEILGVIENA